MINEHAISRFMKNPLVIIGMISVIFEGIALLSFTIGIDRLFGNLERQPIIWFIVGFPIIVLLVIFLLARKNNWVLEATSVYNNRNFIKANQSRIDSERLHEAELLGKLTVNEETKDSESENKDIFSQPIAIGLADASNYFGVSLRKDVAINKDRLSSIVFDGMAYKDDTLCVVKVKLIKGDNWKKLMHFYLQSMSADVACLERAGITVDALLELVLLNRTSPQVCVDDIAAYFYRESRNFGFRILEGKKLVDE